MICDGNERHDPDHVVSPPLACEKTRVQVESVEVEEPDVKYVGEGKEIALERPDLSVEFVGAFKKEG